MKDKKTAGNKKQTGKKQDKKVAAVKKNIKKIVEFYYMSPMAMTAKELSLSVKSMPEEAVEVWNELNLVEVVMDNDSLIFQDAHECFEDPLDLEFIEAHGFKSLYAVSYDVADQVAVCRVLGEILAQMGGIICSDTDDFLPIFTQETIEQLG